jgi:hypothetical protein
MRKILLAILCVLSMNLLNAQIKKIPLGLASNQRFTLLKAANTSDGFVFVGRVTTQISNGYLDTLVEVNTDTELAIKSVNKFFLGNNLLTTVDEALKARYPDLFNKPDYTVGTMPKIKLAFAGGLKKLDNKFSVIPVNHTFHQPTLSYNRRSTPEAVTELAPRFGLNVTEISAYDCSYVDAGGNYFTIFGYYLDKGEDEGKQFKKHYVFKFGPTGNLDAADSIDFPIKRYLSKKNVVKNDKNEFKGMVYLFSAYPMTLRLKPSDSTDLQYNIVYVNEKGKLVYNNILYYGDRKFDLEPMVVTEKEGKLEIITRVYDDSTSCLQFDNGGNLQKVIRMPMVRKEILKARPTLNDFWAIQTYEPVYNFTDKNGETFHLVRQYKQNAAQTGVYENTFGYGKFYYFKVKPDRSVVYLQSYADESGVAPANGLPETVAIQANGDFGDVLLRNPLNDKKVIWRFGDPRFPDVAHGIAAPNQLSFSKDAAIKINDSEYYVVGYNASEIVLNKMVMRLFK